MALPQQKFREVVFQVLYSLDMGEPDEAELIILVMKELSVTKKTVRIALERALEVKKKQIEIDEMIRKAAFSYAFERIQSVERNVLRLGVFEMLFDDSIPPKVAIAEAIRLSRKFSNPESSLFVNALMDNLYKLSMGEKVDSEKLSENLEILDQIEKEQALPPPLQEKKKKN